MASGRAARRRKRLVAARRGPSIWTVVAVVVVVLFAGAIGYGIYTTKRAGEPPPCPRAAARPGW